MYHFSCRRQVSCLAQTGFAAFGKEVILLVSGPKFTETDQPSQKTSLSGLLTIGLPLNEYSTSNSFLLAPTNSEHPYKLVLRNVSFVSTRDSKFTPSNSTLMVALKEAIPQETFCFQSD